MQDVITRPATYSDLEAVPPHLVAEILYGELVTHPRPHPRGTRAATRLSQVLGAPFDLGITGPGGWVFHVEPEIRIGGHAVVPDIAGWRVERQPEITDTSEAYIDVAPDWVCEVISPSTETDDRTRKLRIYEDSGVPYYWLANPLTRVLEVFTLLGAGWTLVATFSDNDTVAAAPFEACPMPLTHFLPRPTPPAPSPSPRERQDG